jgi:lipid-A-disaccharide synthase
MQLEALERMKRPVIAMVAGEQSGDLLGADLIKGLKAKLPHAKFVGIGGDQMQDQGLECWFPMETLSVMGFFEVIKRIPQLLHLRKQLIRNLLALKPDVFIGIDAPDFNFYVERRLKQQNIKTVHYVGPSVWAWRENRLEKIKRSVDGMLVLFPFEPPIYERYQIPVCFVGHPMANQVPVEPDKTAARRKLSIDESVLLTALLPGSRMSEVERMADLYLQAANHLVLIHPQMEFIIPCVHAKAKARIEQAVEKYGKRLKVHLIDGQAPSVLEACDQAIVTSGTATLQTALMLRPMVISIKVHPVSYWIMKRMALSKWIGLPNILAQRDLAPELIQDEATPEKLALALGRIIADSKRRQIQLDAYQAQKESLRQNSSQLAADAVIAWADLHESV